MEIERQRWEPLAKSFIPGPGGFGWSQPYTVGSTYDWEDDMEKEEGLFLFDLESRGGHIAGAWIKKAATEFASYPDSWKLFEGDFDDIGFAVENVFEGQGGRILDVDLTYRDGHQLYDVILVPNYGSAARASWWGSGASAQNLADVLNGEAWGDFKADKIKKKIVALDRSANGRFTFVLNEAKAGEAWWWGYGASIANITTVLNGGAWAGFKVDKVEKRLVSLKRHAKGNWTFLMVPRDGVGWWWYPTTTWTDLAANAEKHNARVIDIERYGNSEDLFSAVLVQNQKAG
jgi:hypothetical protein